MLDSTLALRLAARLTVVKEFPRNPEAIEAIAEDLIDLTLDCEPDEAERRIRWLTEEIRRNWSEWSTQADLQRLYKSKYGPMRQIKSEDNEAKNYGEKPKLCPSCNDTGAFRPGGRESTEPFEWCECDAGILLHLDFPQWLDVLNGFEPPAYKTVKPAPELAHPASERPVSAEVERHITAKQQCPACSEHRPHSHSEFWKHHTTQETTA